MFAPNPNRDMDIDRVVVVGKSADQQRLSVLSVNEIENNRSLFRDCRLRCRRANGARCLASAIALLGGAALAVEWRWWSPIVGLGLAAALVRTMRRNPIDLAAEIVASDKATVARLRASGAIWDVPAHVVVPESMSVYPEHLRAALPTRSLLEL